ncbi:MAG: hypothetical protein P8M30_00925 [Planctomycetaceae bacterium]|nr:hypothetical protein [bacterium]MDB4680196.1 hypothetical protein [Planctomycetaceae bacterium]MDG2387857.1 hypothetical protein [Planctomycetaceae bacterium]
MFGYFLLNYLPTRQILANHSQTTSLLGDFQVMGTKKSGKGRRKLGRKKRKNRAKTRHRKD